MKGDRIPDDNRVARYCKPSVIDEEGNISAAAFHLRDADDYLSVNWLECLGCPSKESEVARLNEILRKKMDIRTKAKIAVLVVGDVIEQVKRSSYGRHILRILHMPKSKDSSHAGIFDMKNEQMEMIAEMIHQRISEIYPTNI